MAEELGIVVKTILEVDKLESRKRIEKAKENLSKSSKEIRLNAIVKQRELQKNLREAIASAEKSVAKTPFKFGVDIKRQEFQKNLKAAISSAQKSVGANPINVVVGVDEAASLKKIDSYIEAARKKIADAKLNLNIESNLVSGNDAGAETGKSKSKKKAKSPSWKTNPQNIEGGKKYRDALENSIRANEHIFKDKNMTRSSTSYFISPKDDQIKAIVEYTDGLGKTASMMFTAKKAAADSGKILENLQVKQLKVVDSQEKYNQAIEKQSKEAEKQRKREESSLNYLNQQENALKNLSSKSFDQKNPLTGDFKVQVDAALKVYEAKIAELRKAGGVLTAEQRRELDNLREEAKRSILEQRSSQYGQASLGAKDITAQKKVRKNELEGQVGTLKKLGLYSGQVADTFDDLQTRLKTISDFKVFQAWQEDLRVAKSEVDKLLSSFEGLGAIQANKIEGKQIAQIESLAANEIISTGTTSGVTGLREQLFTLHENYNSVAEQLRLSANEEEYNAALIRLKELDTQLRATANTAKLFNGSMKSNENLDRIDASIDALKANFKKMKSDWSKAFEIPALRTEINNLEQELQSVDAVSFSRVQSQLEELQANIRLANADSKSFGTQIKDVFGKFMQYFSVADLIRVTTRAIGEMSEKVKELNSAMTELKKVTNLTEQGYNEFLNVSADRAKNIGTGLTDYISGVADFVKQGNSIVDAREMSEAANILYKVGDGFNNIDESTDVVISSIKAFKNEALSATEVIDKLNEVSNKTSITTAGLADAMTRSASALSLSGLSMDKAIALAVAGNETTRDASMTGNALKTLSMRIRGATSDLEDAGEEVDDYVKSTSKMRDEIKGLTGVDIMIDDANFKDLYDIMDELSKIYDTLEDVEKANLTEILFGKLRANVGASILQNFDQAEKALEVAQKSAGSASKEHERWMESIAASEAKAEAAFEQFSSKVLSSDLIKFGYDAQTGILGFLSKIIDLSGSAIPLITTLASGILSLTNNIGLFTSHKGSDNASGFGDMFGIFGLTLSQRGQNKLDKKFVDLFNAGLLGGKTNEVALTDALTEMGKSVDDISKHIIKASESATTAGIQFKALGTGAKFASVGMKLLTTAMNVGVMLAINAAVTLLVKGIDAAITTQEELETKLSNIKAECEESAKTIKDLNTELENTKNIVKQLESKGALTFVEEEQLENAKEQVKLLEQQIKLEQQKAEIQSREQRKAIVETAEGKFKTRDKDSKLPYKNDAELAMLQISTVQANRAKAWDEYFAYGTKNSGISERLKEEAESYDEAFNYYALKIHNAHDYIDDLIGDNERILNPITDADKSFNELFAWRDKLKDALIGIEDNTIQAESAVVQERFAEQFIQIKKIIEEDGAIDVGKIEQNFAEVLAAYVQFGWNVEDVVRHLNETFIVPTNTSPSVPTFDTKASSKFAGSETYNKLIEAIESQNEAGTISIETYTELVKIDEKLVEMLEATSEGYILNTEALYEYIEAQDDMLRMEAYDAIEKLQDKLNDTDLSLDDKNSIEKQISEWELLISEIDNATGALAKWKIANSTDNQDSAFNEGKSMYDVLKEGNKTGKTGTDDFQSAVDFMLGEGWEDRIGTDFKDLYDAYAQAEKNAKKYFGQDDERTGMKNFANELVKNEFATWGKDAQGRKVLSLAEGLNIEDVAAELKMSEDAVKSLFKLMEAYGADFEWSFLLSDKDKENLVEYQESIEAINELNKQISKEKAGLANLEEGSEEYNTALDNIEAKEAAVETITKELEDALSETEESLTLEEALEEISKLQSAIATLNEAGIEVPVTLTGQYDKLQDIITTILGGTETEDGGYSFTVTGLEDAKTKLAGIRTVMEWVKKHPNIAAQLDPKFISALGDAETQLDEIVNGGGEEGTDRTVTITLDPKDDVSGKIDEVVNGEKEGTDRTAEITLSPNDEVSGKIEEIVNGTEPIEGTDFSDGGYSTDITIKYEKDKLSYEQALQDIEDLIKERSVKVKIDTEGDEEAVEDLLNKMNKEEGLPAVAKPDENGEYVVNSVEEYVDKLFDGVGLVGKSFDELFDEIMQKVAKDMKAGLVIPAEEATGEIDPSIVDRSVDNSVSTNIKNTIIDKINDILSKVSYGLSDSEFEQETFQQHRKAAEEVFGEEVDIPIGVNLEDAESAYLTYRDKITKQLVIPIGISGGGAGKNLVEKYAKGTSGASGGLSLVDDGKGANAGAELIEHTSRGTFELGSGNGPRLTMLDKGDVVHTAKETKSILKRLAKVGGFFRNGLNKGKSIIGNAFASGVSGSMVWTDAINAITKTTSSSNSKSKSKSSNNWKKYIDKLFDWIEIRLDRLQTITDKWVLSASNAIGYAAKNADLDKALENTRLQVQETTEAYERYISQAAAVQKKTGLSNSIVKRIQEGTIDISSYSDNTQEKIKAYQEWYDKAMNCVSALSELKEQERELAQEKLDNILNHYQWRIDRLDAVIDKTQESVDLKIATGIEVVESDYDQAIDATKQKIDELNTSRATLATEFENLVKDGYIQEGSEEWNKYTSELEELDQAIISAKIELEDFKDVVDQIAITNLEYAIAGLEDYADSIHGLMSLHDAQGSSHKNTDYESLIRNGMEQIRNLEKQNELLKKQQQNLDKNSEEYQKIQEQISSNNETILDIKVSQEGWNDAVIDLKIQQLQKYQEELQKVNDKYQNQKNLQQAIQDIERARTQRTQRVYREGLGFVFEADQEALQSAQENLESVIHDQLLGKIDELIDAIEKSKNDSNVYDADGNLIGTEYTLPEIENLAALLGGTGASGIVAGITSDAKKAIYDYIVGSAAGQSISVSFGDIVLEGVNDPNVLANAIVDQFSNAVTQAIYSKI